LICELIAHISLLLSLCYIGFYSLPKRMLLLIDDEKIPNTINIGSNFSLFYKYKHGSCGT
jgi:hypothetical protein